MRPLALFSALALSLPAHAWTPADLEAAAMLRERALQHGAAEAQVRALVAAAPFRFAGTDAKRRAEAWALQALRAAGLQNVRAEPVTVPRWQRGPLRLQLLGAQPQELNAVALGGSVATPPGGVRAPVLMLDSLEALRALPPAQVKGRIVFLNRRMERRADGSGYGEAVGIRVKGPAEAGRRGAAALLIRSVGTNHDREAHTGSLRYDAIAPKIAAAALSPADADLLAARLAAGPAEVQLTLQAASLGEAQEANIIGEIPGHDAKLAHEVVLLAAHLDSWDTTPGANDDGAGVGIVIEALRNIVAAGVKPQRTLRVLLTANEEFGLSGAKAYARGYARELERHQLALEADFGSGAVQVLNAGVAAQDWPRVQLLAPLLEPLGVKLGANGKGGGADTGPLHERGVPVLGPRQEGSRYFDLHHTAADTVDTLDSAGLKQNVAVYSVLAWLAAQGPAWARVPVTAAD